MGSTRPTRRRKAPPRPTAKRAELAVFAAAALLTLGACGSPGARWSTSWDAPYASFDADARSALVAARGLADEGRRADALALLVEVTDRDPGNIEVAALVQDLEEALLLDGVDLFAPEHSLADITPDVALRLEYAARAAAEPTVVTEVLRARAETDLRAAATQLERAIDLDPTCAWAHYGLSHVLLGDRSRVDRWSGARQALARALELDPGHVRARRLEAWMAAQEGSRADAEALLVRWIEEVEDDPRVGEAERVEARLDLALLLLLRGEDRRALRLLEDLEGARDDRARRLMLLTVARQEGGDALGALDAALRAQGAGQEGEALPLVQEALVLELFLERPDEAEERWQEVARLGEGAANLADLIQGLRARVRLERAADSAQGER
ncbi:MAG: tetratricopeptide repeat protein [Planctomycetota bacterium]|nr:tetratricopeptide repeat protein [Planctomycetota bacterium]